MKKTILIFITALGVLQAPAQNINPEVDNIPPADVPATQSMKANDKLFTGWCFDINVLGGLLTQNLTTVNIANNYTNPLRANIGNLSFNNGISLGADAEVAKFFGAKKHFGIGAGLLYMYQQGDVTLNNFHIEYQSVDNFGNPFRQLITADQPIKETLTISNINIPILLKYRTQFSNKWGFTADAGLLINLQEKNSYNTNASFDYEAIYKYVTNDNGTTSAVYDNSATPASSDVLITKSQYLTTHTEAQLQTYFNTLKNEGYNVGLGVNPQNNTGNTTFTAFSLGLMVRPAVSYNFSDNVALNMGVYYIYQDFNNTPPSNYQLTNKAGSYNSVTNSVNSSVNNTYGISIGIRYFFNRKKAEVPEVAPEVVDSVAAPPPAPAPEPVVAPDTTEEQPETIDVSTPILFELNRTAIHPSSYPVLEEAAKEIEVDKGAYIEINGYTDITGSSVYNLALSKKRAMVVKNYLRKKGVSPKQMKTIGHGAKSPAASNKTREGRAANRRVVMKIKQK